MERSQRIAGRRVEQLQRVRVAVALRNAGGPQFGLDVAQVGLGAADPVLDQEAPQPLPHPGVLELVGEHRGHGHRQVARHLEHRQVGAHHRVEQPLLAERVGPEALDVGHVRVQDDREIAAVPAAPPDRRVRAGRRQGSRARGRGPPPPSRKSEAAIAGVKRS